MCCARYAKNQRIEGPLRLSLSRRKKAVETMKEGAACPPLTDHCLHAAAEP
jgi:hypothetical protein